MITSLLFRAAFLSVFHTSDLKICLQMILYDTPGVIEKKMHKLDSMMMNNVRSAAINADCVVVLVDACKMPQKVCFFSFLFSLSLSLSFGVELSFKICSLFLNSVACF